MRPSALAGWMLLALLAGCEKSAGPAEEGKGEHEESKAHVTARTEPARKANVVDTVEGLGRCEAIPDRLASLTPAVEGHVHQLLAKQGEEVKKGQPIVELDRTAALADLAEKTAVLDSMKAALALLKAPPRAEERKVSEVAVESGKVAVDRAKAVLDRLRPLLASHEVSQQQVFDAEQAWEAVKLQRQSAEATLKALLIGPKPEAVAEAEAKIKTAEGAVGFSKAHLDFHTIASPIDGVLDSLTCHPGQTIAIGAPIGDVVDTRQVFATVWLPPRSVHRVRAGQPARVAPGDEPGTDEKAAPVGKVESVGKVADPQTGNLPVRVLVDNPDGRLTPGETIAVAITVDEHGGVFQVPAAAIFDEGEGLILNVVREGKSVALHPEVGPVHEGWVAVSGTDLKEGEPVIVEGGYHLPEGTTIDSEPEKSVAKAETKP